MRSTHLLTIKAQERPGLLHLITGVFNRKLVPIISLNAAQTDIHDIVLITIEAILGEDEVTKIAYKLENIVEVYAVEVNSYQEDMCLRAAWFKLDRVILETSKIAMLQKYNAVIVQWYPNAFLLAKYGTAKSIREFYNQLDGPHLLGFSQTGLITDSKLIGEDQSSVINRLAA